MAAQDDKKMTIVMNMNQSAASEWTQWIKLPTAPVAVLRAIND